VSSSAITGPLLSDVSRSADGSAAAPSWSFQNSPTMGFYRVSANVLGLSTAGVQRMVVDASGNVGIGTASPANQLELSTTSDPTTCFYRPTSSVGNGIGRLQWDGNNAASARATYGRIQVEIETNTTGSHNGRLLFYTTGSGALTERMRIDASGYLIVGRANSTVPGSSDGFFVGPLGDATAVMSTGGNVNTYHVYNRTSASFRFFVSRDGQINATSTSITGISDISLKENIRDLETGLPEILALKPRRFDWKEETHLEQKNVAGFIAQELEEVLPELVYEYKYNETETKKSIKMGDILPTLVRAVQEQQAMIESMKAEIEALKAK
jgi:hypothetical protein